MSKAIYSYRYEQRDFGTERHLTVFIRATGQEIGTRDPFWQTGILLDPAGRRRRFLKVSREIIREYEARGQGSGIGGQGLGITSTTSIRPQHPLFPDARREKPKTKN